LAPVEAQKKTQKQSTSVMEKQESGADFWGKSHQEIPSFLLSQAKPTAFGPLHRLVALTIKLSVGDKTLSAWFFGLLVA